MAEFGEVMRQWRRMCKALDNQYKDSSCYMCPLKNITEKGCGAIWQMDEIKDLTPIGEAVMKWAAEHPESVYPTWFEWLEKIGVAGKAYQLESYFSGYKEILLKTEVFTPKAFTAIPADIAEKLGIEPK